MAEITQLTNGTRLIDSVDILNTNFSNLNDGKQDAISDLDTIRSNASTGAGLATQVGTNTSDISTLSSQKVDKANTTSFTISAGEKSLVGGSDESLKWVGNNIETVVDSGNGYIRYASGFQICWGYIDGNQDIIKVWTYPKPFASNPSISAIAYKDSSTSYNVNMRTVDNENATFLVVNNTYITGIGINVTAVGVWK